MYPEPPIAVNNLLTFNSNDFKLHCSPNLSKSVCFLTPLPGHTSLYPGGLGRGHGVGRGLGVALGVAVAVDVGVGVIVGITVDVGVVVGVTVGVTVGLTVGVGVGVIGGVGVGHGIGAQPIISTVSTRQPSLEPLVSLAILQRSVVIGGRTTGKLTTVVMKPCELPLHA